MQRTQKKKPVDPRKRPGNLPDGTHFIKGRENPGYGFSSHIEFKSETKPEVSTTPIQPVVPRKKPKYEWKLEAKPCLSQLPIVIGELRESILKKDNKLFRKIIAKITSIYIHNLNNDEPSILISEISSMFDHIHRSSPNIEELLHLVRSIFIKYDVSDTVAAKFYETLKTRMTMNVGCVFSVLEILLKKGKLPPESCSNLISSAKKRLLHDTDSSRLYTAKFLIEFLKRTNSEKLKNDLKRHLMDYCNDRCPKVKRIVIEGIEQFFECEKTAPLEYYDLFTDLTRNLDVFVRLSALRIVKLYADFYPEEIVSKKRNFPLRITDDAFTFVCHAMNDLVVEVRSEAAKLLGTFSNVTESFLFQTLDKKLMKNMQRLSDGRTVVKNSGWSTGKKLGEDCPVEEQEEEAQSMIPTGACGAFVTALEDEFKAVRLPAVYSLGQLAANRPAFANASIGHLADMFNDEIAAVRIDAIRALTPLVTYGVLEIEQLKTLLTGLDDASQESRVALMELLSRSNFVQQECISYLLGRLLDTMRRFPEDKKYIFKCISSIGTRHADLVVDIVYEVFKLHPYLERQEEKIDDPYYLTKLIMILNAASKSKAVCALLPNYVKKHYRFLRLSMPNLVNEVNDFDTEGQVVTFHNNQNEEKQQEDIDLIVGREYDRLLAILEKKDYEQREKDLKQLLNDMKFFLSVEPQFANASNYLYSLSNLILIIDGIVNNILIGNIPPFLEIQDAMEKISFLKHRFLGADSNVQMFLMECSLILCLVYCGARLIMDQNFISNFSEIILSEIKRIKRGLEKINEEPTTRLNRLMKYFTDMSTQKPLGGALLEFVGSSTIKLESRAQNLPEIGLKTVKIVEPAEVIKIQLITGLPTGVYVNCILNHFTEEDINLFKVKVKYFDESCAYFLPPKSDYEKIDKEQYRLRTHVIVVAKEGLVLPAMVDLTFGLFIPSNEVQSVIFHDRCFAFTPSIRTSANENGYFVSLPDADNLLKPATCRVQTKPMQVRTVS